MPKRATAASERFDRRTRVRFPKSGGPDDEGEGRAAPTPFPPGDPNGSSPYLVRDIHPGWQDSRLSDFAAFAGKLYFAADDGADGLELWTTDGSERGTVLVKDIFPGASPSLMARPNRLLFAGGGQVFFTADD